MEKNPATPGNPMNRKKSSRTIPLVITAQGTYRKAYSMIENIFIQSGYEPKKNSFFIKPNLVDAFHPRSGIVTHPAVIEAIIQYLQRYYPGAEIIIGDSCGVHVSFDRVIRKAGYSHFEKKYGVRILSLDTVERYSQKWKHGTLKLPALLKTHEYINVAKMKTHLQTSVSLGIKNQKGLLDTNIKKNFHRTYDLHNCISSLADIVQPDFTIIDGILSLEGNGPLDTGTPKKDTGLIIASTSMIAADNAAATIMGYDINEIAHMPIAQGFEIVGHSLEKCMRPHVRPNEKFVEILNTHIYIDKTMCTQCAVPFKDAFRDPVFLMKVIGLGGLRGIKNIIFGKYSGSIDNLDNTIGFGDCTSKTARKMGFPTVQGCPPTPETIKKHYIQFLKNNKKKKGH